MKRRSAQQLDLLEGRVSSSRPPAIRVFLGEDEVAVDNFCGAGGVSVAFRRVIGRSPHIACNHSLEAAAVYSANHPDTEIHVESIYKVDPAKVCKGRPCGIVWFSPDCTHHSRAKGGKPRNNKLRGLAWVSVTWAKRVLPRVIAFENVIEFEQWGPLHRTHVDGCEPGVDGDEVVCSVDTCHFAKPIRSRRGETFRALNRKLESYGYIGTWWKVRCSDQGSPTSRVRLFGVFRLDRASRRPMPTHGPGLQPYRTAGECVDWSLPCPSIFERGRDLSPPTLARVARGAHAFVLDTPTPYIVTLRGTDESHLDSSARSIDEPLRTISAKGNHHAIVVPYLVHRSNGEREGQAPRIYDINKPLGTVVAGGPKHALVAAYLVKNYGGNESSTGGSSLHQPMATITAQDHHSLTAAFLVRYNRTSPPAPLDRPLGTLDTRDRFGLVASDLIAEPLTKAQRTRARRVARFLRAHGYTVPGEFAIVVVGGEEFIVADLGFRMLQPPELAKATGLPDDYILAPIGPNGKPLSNAAQTRMIGNAVPPDAAAAVLSVALEAA